MNGVCVCVCVCVRARACVKGDCGGAYEYQTCVRMNVVCVCV